MFFPAKMVQFIYLLQFLLKKLSKQHNKQNIKIAENQTLYKIVSS